MSADGGELSRRRRRGRRGGLGPARRGGCPPLVRRRAAPGRAGARPARRPRVSRSTGRSRSARRSPALSLLVARDSPRLVARSMLGRCAAIAAARLVATRHADHAAPTADQAEDDARRWSSSPGSTPLDAAAGTTVTFDGRSRTAPTNRSPCSTRTCGCPGSRSPTGPTSTSSPTRSSGPVPASRRSCSPRDLLAPGATRDVQPRGPGRRPPADRGRGVRRRHRGARHHRRRQPRGASVGR